MLNRRPDKRFTSLSKRICLSALAIVSLALAIDIAPLSSCLAAGGKEKGKADSQTKTGQSTLKIKKRIRPASKSLTQQQSIALGKKLYNQYQCFDCHSIGGKGCASGFSLDNVGTRRTKSFIAEHLKDPDKHFDKHPQAFGTDMNLMPPQNLEAWEIEGLTDYLYSLK